MCQINFLILFAPHMFHFALLCPHAWILALLSTGLMVLSVLGLKPTFSPSLSLLISLSLTRLRTDLMA